MTHYRIYVDLIDIIFTDETAYLYLSKDRTNILNAFNAVEETIPLDAAFYDSFKKKSII